MRIKSLALILTIVVATALTSCLSDGDSDVTYYDDDALTAFSLGTLNIVRDTVSSTGEDSTYTTTLDCSSYLFTIDQETNRVYNLDSLPYGIDVTKVLVTASSKNSGLIGVKKISSDTVNIYSSTDSIDFSEPRHFYVYNMRTDVYRDYTITVNVHQQKENELKWNSDAIVYDDFASMTGLRAVAMDGRVYVFGTDGTGTRVYSASESDARTWSEASANVDLDGKAYLGACALDGKLYVLNGTTLLSSTDGATWTEVSSPAISQLLGASEKRLYALAQSGGIMSSNDGGATWTADGLDSDASLLPTGNYNLITLPLLTNQNTYRVVLIGTGASEAQVWGKIEENDALAENQPWAYYNPTSENDFKAPNLNDLQVINYDGGIFSLGGSAIGETDSTPFEYFYRSLDAGLTWHADSTYFMPTGFSAPDEVFAMTKDSKGYLWIICGTTGQVWHGAKNKLTWADDKRYFIE